MLPALWDPLAVVYPSKTCATGFYSLTSECLLYKFPILEKQLRSPPALWSVYVCGSLVGLQSKAEI